MNVVDKMVAVVLKAVGLVLGSGLGFGLGLQVRDVDTSRTLSTRLLFQLQDKKRSERREKLKA